MLTVARQAELCGLVNSPDVPATVGTRAPIVLPGAGAGLDPSSGAGAVADLAVDRDRVVAGIDKR